MTTEKQEESKADYTIVICVKNQKEIPALRLRFGVDVEIGADAAQTAIVFSDKIPKNILADSIEQFAYYIRNSKDEEKPSIESSTIITP